MKQIMIWMILAVGLLVGACHQTTVGYLLTENASYDPDTMYIRKTLDPELDAVRIENKAPWVSLALQGYEGTQQILLHDDRHGISQNVRVSGIRQSNRHLIDARFRIIL